MEFVTMEQLKQLLEQFPNTAERVGIPTAILLIVLAFIFVVGLFVMRVIWTREKRRIEPACVHHQSRVELQVIGDEAGTG